MTTQALPHNLEGLPAIHLPVAGQEAASIAVHEEPVDANAVLLGSEEEAAKECCLPISDTVNGAPLLKQLRSEVEELHRELSAAAPEASQA